MRIYEMRLAVLRRERINLSRRYGRSCVYVG